MQRKILIKNKFFKARKKSKNIFFNKYFLWLKKKLMLKIKIYFLDSKIKFCATCTSRTSRWWSARTSCSNCAALSLKVWAAQWPGENLQRPSSFHFRLRPAQVHNMHIHINILIKFTLISTGPFTFIISIPNDFKTFKFRFRRKTSSGNKQQNRAREIKVPSLYLTAYIKTRFSV